MESNLLIDILDENDCYSSNTHELYYHNLSSVKSMMEDKLRNADDEFTELMKTPGAIRNQGKRLERLLREIATLREINNYLEEN